MPKTRIARKTIYVLGLLYRDGFWYATTNGAVALLDQNWKLIRRVKHRSFRWLHSVTERDGVVYVASCIGGSIAILDRGLRIQEIQPVSLYTEGLPILKRFQKGEWGHHLNHIEPLRNGKAILSVAATPALVIADLRTRERLEVIRMPTMTHHPRDIGHGRILCSGTRHLYLVGKDKKVKTLFRRNGWLRGLTPIGRRRWLSMDVDHHTVREFSADRNGRWSSRPVFNIPPQYRGHKEYEVMPEPPKSDEDLAERLVAMGYV